MLMLPRQGEAIARTITGAKISPVENRGSADREALRKLLIHGRGSREVYGPPLTGNDCLSNLGCGFAFLVLRVRIVQFFQADVTSRPVSIFEAAMQAIVSHSVAITIARLLVDHRLDLGGQLISMGLIGILSIFAPQLIPA